MEASVVVCSPLSHRIPATLKICQIYRAGGTSSGDKFAGKTSFFSLLLNFFPRNFCCAIWGTSCSLCILCGGGSQVLLRCCCCCCCY